MPDKNTGAPEEGGNTTAQQEPGKMIENLLKDHANKPNALTRDQFYRLIDKYIPRTGATLIEKTITENEQVFTALKDLGMLPSPQEKGDNISSRIKKTLNCPIIVIVIVGVIVLAIVGPIVWWKNFSKEVSYIDLLNALLPFVKNFTIIILVFYVILHISNIQLKIFYHRRLQKTLDRHAYLSVFKETLDKAGESLKIDVSGIKHALKETGDNSTKINVALQQVNESLKKLNENDKKDKENALAQIKIALDTSNQSLKDNIATIENKLDEAGRSIYTEGVEKLLRTTSDYLSQDSNSDN